jgi:UDPglucose 6-dehydrogenase
MIVGIIGFGIVGSATAEVLSRIGHSVFVEDIDPHRMERAAAEGLGRLNRDIETDVLFICVPETRVREALASAPCSAITVIRSTVPPGTTELLSAEMGRPLAFMPETLREATYIWDALNPHFILIGSHDEEQGRVLADLFAPLMVQHAIVPPSTAEMVKLALNAYLHTLISFWNEIHVICERTGIASHHVGILCSQDPRVSNYGARMHGEPAGGRCLPKDLRQLLAFAAAKGYAPELLTAVRNINEKVPVLPDADTSLNGHRNGEELRHLQPGSLSALPTQLNAPAPTVLSSAEDGA